MVRETELPNTLRLVAEKHIAKAGPDGVTLAITRKHFETLKEYIQTEYFSPSYFVGLASQEHLKLPMEFYWVLIIIIASSMEVFPTRLTLA